MRGAAAGREPDRRRVRHRDAARVRADVPPVASGSGWYLKAGDAHSRGLTPPTTASRRGLDKPAIRNTVHAMRRAAARTAPPSDAGGVRQFAQAAAVRCCRPSSRCRSNMIACIGLAATMAARQPGAPLFKHGGQAMGRRCADRLSPIRDRYRRAAWRGRIRIVNGTIHRFGSNGFEHVENPPGEAT